MNKEEKLGSLRTHKAGFWKCYLEIKKIKFSSELGWFNVDFDIDVITTLIDAANSWDKNGLFSYMRREDSFGGDVYYKGELISPLDGEPGEDALARIYLSSLN